MDLNLCASVLCIWLCVCVCVCECVFVCVPLHVASAFHSHSGLWPPWGLLGSCVFTCVCVSLCVCVCVCVMCVMVLESCLFSVVVVVYY